MAAPKYRTAPLKTDRMPPGIPYIVGNEAAERFSYYGMNSILVLFMTQYLVTASGQPDLTSAEQADAWYHTFVFVSSMSCCVLGAFLADALIGKYRTILFASRSSIALGTLPSRWTTRVGVDRGAEPDRPGRRGHQTLRQRERGGPVRAVQPASVTSRLQLVLFLDQLRFRFRNAPDPLAAGPLSGRPPAWPPGSPPGPCIPWRNVTAPALPSAPPASSWSSPPSSSGSAAKSSPISPPPAFDRSPHEFTRAENLKALGNLLILVPFVAMFWALWQQNFSSWVVQAYKMNRHLFGIDWLPAQIQTVNPIFILIMLPLFSYAIYPAMNKVFRLTPLRKIGLGLLLVVLAFLIIGWIQRRIDAGQHPHILWQILAFLVLTAAEVLVSVTHLEFAYTQAPKSMKSLVMCTYLGAVSLGNAFTAWVNHFIQNPDGSVKLSGASYFFFFAKAMFVTALLFIAVASVYRGKTYIQDEAETPAAA